MKHFVLLLTFLLLPLLSWGEVCSTVSNSAFDALNDLSKNSCEQIVKSKACTDLYGKMKDAGENPADKAPNCSDGNSLAQEYSAWSYTSGCAIGGWNFVKDTFVGMGTAVADGAKSVGKLVDDVELENAANKTCDADPNGKMQLIEQYNQNVPKLLKIAKPSDAVLAKVNCAKVKATIKLQQGQKADELSLNLNRKMLLQKATLTPDEKELVEWGQRRLPGTETSLLDAAKAKLKEVGVRLECYSSQQAAAMVCEAIAEVGTVAIGPAGWALKASRMRNIAKIAGVSVDASKATSGARMVATAADLEKAAKLSNVERIAAAEKSLGRTLTSAEQKALIDAHEVAAQTGRGYGTYSATDLKNKADILKTAGFSDTERELLMRQGLAGSLSSGAAARTYSNTMRLQAEKLLSSGKTNEAKQSFRSAADSFEAVVNDVKLTKSDRDYWMGAKINANAERYDKAADYFIKSYSKETGNSKSEAIYEALKREKQELRAISSQNPSSVAAQSNYQTHRKLIEAVVSNPQLRLSDALKGELLRP
ncbi:hypothetical protein [Bdellovibrio sp. KM01]|uniref:hypothetical protein n=1 Tax=Bdellovibrio sp. KM01 TaxID=2748865 RepID=UPI0015E97D23|nr:hypothetical protein [Bdellovibrio sp. KM01]QLY25420.1 hypothetical protein HW988_18750 [Bdellovibrio sp. KM01]